MPCRARQNDLVKAARCPFPASTVSAMDVRRGWDLRGAVAWGLAWVVALALSWVRFRSAMRSADRPDVDDFFLAAPRGVRDPPTRACGADA